MWHLSLKLLELPLQHPIGFDMLSFHFLLFQDIFKFPFWFLFWPSLLISSWYEDWGSALGSSNMEVTNGLDRGRFGGIVVGESQFGMSLRNARKRKFGMVSICYVLNPPHLFSCIRLLLSMFRHIRYSNNFMFLKKSLWSLLICSSWTSCSTVTAV